MSLAKKSFALLIAVALFALVPSAEAGPLGRLVYRARHPFAPIGSYSGPRGVFGRRSGGCASGGFAPAMSGGCANGSCSR